MDAKTQTMYQSELLPLAMLQISSAKHSLTNSYTAFNFMMLIIATLLRKREWWPVIFSNTLSLNVLFYISGTLIDTTFFQRMREFHDVSMSTFIVGDIAFHLLPSTYLIWSVVQQKQKWIEIYKTFPELQYSGLYSLFINLMWALLYDFDLNKVYVPQHVHIWYISWMIVAMSHLSIGYMLHHVVSQ